MATNWKRAEAEKAYRAAHKKAKEEGKPGEECHRLAIEAQRKRRDELKDIKGPDPLTVLFGSD